MKRFQVGGLQLGDGFFRAKRVEAIADVAE